MLESVANVVGVIGGCVGGHREPHQLQREWLVGILRRAVLDDVEAAHVRVPGRGAGAAGDPGVQKGVPDVLCARAGLRRQEAGADRRFLGRQAQEISDCEISNLPSFWQSSIPSVDCMAP